jgi:DNA mismatch endonuclease Vsr
VRRILREAGIGYRLGGAGLPGKPDVVMKGRRVALFVHGCFWHGHDCARGARQPKANADYWIAKIGRNRARDAAQRRGPDGARLARGHRLGMCDEGDRFRDRPDRGDQGCRI